MWFFSVIYSSINIKNKMVPTPRGLSYFCTINSVKIARRAIATVERKVRAGAESKGKV